METPPGGPISGGYFSRKKWHTLVGEMAAEADARATAARNRKLGTALREAARDARDATEYLAPDADASAKVLAETLQFAVRIKDATAAIERLAHVRHEAERLRQILDDDEEVAILMLLS